MRAMPVLVFSGSGCHGEQHLAPAFGDGRLCRPDSPDLKGIQREAVAEWLRLQVAIGAVVVALEQGNQSFRGVPTIQRVPEIVGAAQVAEPDAAARRELAQVGASVRGKDEGQPIGAPGATRRLAFLRQQNIAAVALGLL